MLRVGSRWYGGRSRLAVGDTAVAERKGEAFAPAAEVEDLGDQGVLVHLCTRMLASGAVREPRTTRSRCILASVVSSATDLMVDMKSSHGRELFVDRGLLV